MLGRKRSDSEGKKEEECEAWMGKGSKSTESGAFGPLRGL